MLSTEGLPCTVDIAIPVRQHAAERATFMSDLPRNLLRSLFDIHPSEQARCLPPEKGRRGSQGMSIVPTEAEIC